jgi:hypothetical protein
VLTAFPAVRSTTLHIRFRHLDEPRLHASAQCNSLAITRLLTIRNDLAALRARMLSAGVHDRSSNTVIAVIEKAKQWEQTGRAQLLLLSISGYAPVTPLDTLGPHGVSNSSVTSR